MTPDCMNPILTLSKCPEYVAAGSPKGPEMFADQPESVSEVNMYSSTPTSYGPLQLTLNP